MATAFLRTVILYFLIMAGLRLMGKRQIGELEPSELVLTMMLSDLATVPMQDFGIPLLSGVIPILTLLSLSMLLSQLSLRSVRLRRVLCGSPTVLIDRGKLRQDAMRKNRFTLDELLEELRAQGVCDLKDVKYAVLENSGQLSVLPWPSAQPPAARDLGVSPEDGVSLPVILINDGRLITQNLQRCGRDPKWLRAQLKRQGLSDHRQVFLMTVDEQGKTVCIPKEASE
ncbi:DUF421 domain-containing protein [uncultured Oscillibacter sp.]|uniref:DUF421 domain-containing protein n=1 Tax=uncultured Oscillibacter sp. TaxID=876091 RepID=UPI0025FA3AB2|nr:DUF421 domain-containing protein [uncultured Oscillibacter sp.]